MTLLADIASGHTALADVAFLVAVILGVIAGVAVLVKALTSLALPLVGFAVAAVALGFLVL
jgi:hypothetical protein